MGEVLALDPAIKTGIAQGEPGSRPTLETLNLAREFDSHPDIFARAIVWMTRRLIARPAVLLVIEALVPMYDKTLQQGIWACFAGVACAKGIPVKPAPIATWRRYALGSARLAKDDAKREALELCRRFGWHAPDHNAAEAACIWLWACAEHDPIAAAKLRPEPLFTRIGAA